MQREQEQQILAKQAQRVAELEQNLELLSGQREDERKQAEASFHERMAMMKHEVDAEKQKREEIEKAKVSPLPA